MSKEPENFFKEGIQMANRYMKNCCSTTNHKGDAEQNHIEISLQDC